MGYWYVEGWVTWIDPITGADEMDFDIPNNGPDTAGVLPSVP